MGNRFRYKPQPTDTIIELKVRVLLNPDPDAYWSKPEDIIKEIEGHNYVQSVELVEGGGRHMIQGRILRVAFGDNLVAELGKIITPPSTFGLQTGRDGPLPFAKLYDVNDFDGERVLRDLGPPPGALYGRDVSAMFSYPQFWVSQADIDEGRVK